MYTQALSALQEREGVVVDVDSKPALNFGLAAVVYQWARGMSFKDITQMTMVQLISLPPYSFSLPFCLLTITLPWTLRIIRCRRVRSCDASLASTSSFETFAMPPEWLATPPCTAKWRQPPSVSRGTSSLQHHST